jgi:hypothetical protein
MHGGHATAPERISFFYSAIFSLLACMFSMIQVPSSQTRRSPRCAPRLQLRSPSPHSPGRDFPCARALGQPSSAGRSGRYGSCASVRRGAGPKASCSAGCHATRAATSCSVRQGHQASSSTSRARVRRSRRRCRSRSSCISKEKISARPAAATRATKRASTVGSVTQSEQQTKRKQAYPRS